MDRAHSAIAQDVQLAEPGRWRGPFGHMPEGRNALGGVSLLTFFAQAKKVSRSPAGRVEALLLNNQKQELDSSLRWNDEQKAKSLDEQPLRLLEAPPTRK